MRFLRWIHFLLRRRVCRHDVLTVSPQAPWFPVDCECETACHGCGQVKTVSSEFLAANYFRTREGFYASRTSRLYYRVGTVECVHCHVRHERSRMAMIWAAPWSEYSWEGKCLGCDRMFDEMKRKEAPRAEARPAGVLARKGEILRRAENFKKGRIV